MAEGPAAGLSEHPVRKLRFDGLEARVPRFPREDALMSNSPIPESFPVDMDPAQVVRWIMVERAAAPSALKTTARRVTEVREIPARSELHLGDAEREDLSELATIATLEITPAHERDRWLLTVTVEDEIGPRLLGAGVDVGAEQQIDIGTFYSEFIRPGRGIANVVARADGPSARAKVTRLLSMIERNQHPAEPGLSLSGAADRAKFAR